MIAELGYCHVQTENSDLPDIEEFLTQPRPPSKQPKVAQPAKRDLTMLTPNTSRLASNANETTQDPG